MRRILLFALAVWGILVLFVAGPIAPLSELPCYAERGLVAAIPTPGTFQTRDAVRVPSASGMCLRVGKGSMGFVHPFCISLENTC